MTTKHTPADLADEFERRAKQSEEASRIVIHHRKEAFARSLVWREAAVMLREAIKQENSHVG
jgi:hypothetical protein